MNDIMNDIVTFLMNYEWQKVTIKEVWTRKDHNLVL